MNTPDYPLINGHRYSFSSIEATFNGKKYIGFSAINFDEELEPGEVRGASAELLGRTRGDYKTSGSYEMYLQEDEVFIEALGDGYGEVSFNITVMYAEDNSPVIQKTLIGCRIKKGSHGHTKGTDGLSVKRDLSIVRIKSKGDKEVMMIKQLDTRGL